uniref:3-hydroxypropionyl-coenzyme A dehydratase n=1 Tax=Lygus hesperus TaxID=30085 RepID=A0A0A9WG94_LYGHE
MDSNPHNIIDDKFLDDFEQALDRLESEFHDYNVVITGNSKTFSSGMDLKVLKQLLIVAQSTMDHKTMEIVEKIALYVDRVDKLGWRLFRYVLSNTSRYTCSTHSHTHTHTQRERERVMTDT